MLQEHVKHSNTRLYQTYQKCYHVALIGTLMHTITRIAILGPESSGKTTLCTQLATRLNALWVREYTREYVPAQNGVYTESDLIAIYQGQLALNHAGICEAQAGGYNCVLFDTDAIVLAVWAQMSLAYVPDMIEQACAEQSFDHYLLLSPDLPWQADPLRSAPELGKRQLIFSHYETYLRRYHRHYSIIDGQGEDRILCALNALKQSNIANI